MSHLTLHAHLTATQTDPALAHLIENIASTCISIAHEIRIGAFKGNLGAAGATNVQGEEQKTLDVKADEEFARICGANPNVAALISEEVEDVSWVKDPEAGDFLLYFDPLDGSSNIAVDLSVGSIFSIMQVAADGDRDVLLPGTRQIAAGYAVYGPSLMLVITTGQGVQGFTFDPDAGAFGLTHPDMTVPAETSEYAINCARRRYWDAGLRRYIEDCEAGKDGPRGRNFNMRWTASMVADVHRILNRGGVFIYPRDAGNAATGGKLRLMYEANPMSMLIEAAGGAASVAPGRIMEVQPSEPHMRVPVVLGSKAEVAEIDRYHCEG